MYKRQNLVSVHQTAPPPLTVIAAISLLLTTHLSIPRGLKAELAGLQRTVYPYKWLPINCRSGAGQEKIHRSQTDALPLSYTTNLLTSNNKQANFKKIIMRRPMVCYLFNVIRFHFHLCVAGIPRRSYDALSVTALIGLVTLTVDFLTSKQVHGLPV